jgi:hypothetical protein
MGNVHRLPDQRREYIADGARSELRATWHPESGVVVVSMWRGDGCVASSHLSPAEAGRLGNFITSSLAEAATDLNQTRANRAGWTGYPSGPRGKPWQRLASWLQKAARRLTSD